MQISHSDSGYSRASRRLGVCYYPLILSLVSYSFTVTLGSYCVHSVQLGQPTAMTETTQATFGNRQHYTEIDDTFLSTWRKRHFTHCSHITKYHHQQQQQLHPYCINATAVNARCRHTWKMIVTYKAWLPQKGHEDRKQPCQLLNASNKYLDTTKFLVTHLLLWYGASDISICGLSHRIFLPLYITYNWISPFMQFWFQQPTIMYDVKAARDRKSAM